MGNRKSRQAARQTRYLEDAIAPIESDYERFADEDPFGNLPGRNWLRQDPAGQAATRHQYRQNMPSVVPRQAILRPEKSRAPRYSRSRVSNIPGVLEMTPLPDSMGICDDPSVLKAVMPCGHIMGEEAMASYVSSVVGLVNDCGGDYHFLCPLCQAEWPYHLVQHVAQLPPALKAKVEEKLAANFMMKTKGYRQCTKCETWCYRENPASRNVNCMYCTTKLGRAYNFCWVCGQQWRTGDVLVCGNTDCDGVDPRVRVLESYLTKTIQYGGPEIAGCPEIRACPKCGVLIEHTEACKHMTCTCGHSFCFVCLRGKSEQGAWQCGSYNTPCEPAPRQTTELIVGA